jgi:hypothetical protein
VLDASVRMDSFNPMWVPPHLAGTSLIVGNGESRSWFKPCHQTIAKNGVNVWGCNAIYRDGEVDCLVATDPAMQQEIYDSGYAFEHICFFVDWQRLPRDVGETFLMGFDIPDELVFYSIGESQPHSECVIRGKDPTTVQEKVKEALEKFPHLDKPDLIQKMEKDTGVWITWVKEKDEVIHFDFPRGWSTGCSAMHLACQNGSREVYILGFDLSVYEEPLNNIYKGTDNYLPADSKGFNPVNWSQQMQATFVEFRDVEFYWVDCQLKEKFYYSNLSYLTKDELCDILQII